MANCRSCNAEIFWATTATGARIPVDVAPVADGNLQLTDGLDALVLSKADVAQIKARNPAAKFHVSHFATCVNAKSHRKAK